MDSLVNSRRQDRIYFLERRFGGSELEGHLSGLPTIRPSEPGPINPTALLAVNPSECCAGTNGLEGDFWT